MAARSARDGNARARERGGGRVATASTREQGGGGGRARPRARERGGGGGRARPRARERGGRVIAAESKGERRRARRQHERKKGREEEGVCYIEEGSKHGRGGEGGQHNLCLGLGLFPQAPSPRPQVF